MANLLFVITWLPASIVLVKRWSQRTCSWTSPLGLNFPQLRNIPMYSSWCNYIWQLHRSFTDLSQSFFEKTLPYIVIKYKYICLFFFTALASCAAIVVFYYPKLGLPHSKEFQLFKTNHPFEQYDLYLKKKFWFEKARDEDLHRKLPIRITWGVLPDDSGNYLDPFDRGNIVFDADFNIAEPEAQRWLYNFCIQIRNQSFYQPTHGPLMFNCFIETLKSWMERPCVDGISDVNRSPCCEETKFPFTEEVFNYCIKEALKLIHHTPGYFVVPTFEGLRFSRSTGKVQALVVQYESIFSFSNSYKEMHEFMHHVDDWVSERLKTAPKSLKNGWFYSDLDFFDLQDSLSKGSTIAIGLAVAVSFIALLLTTLNLLVSLYAIITISCVIIVTIASLVLLGWKLNVLESTTVSIAIGLTLHYAVALSPHKNRESFLF